jgi:hypothetical protein
MRRLFHCTAAIFGIGGICWAARCTTVAPPGILREYDNYVAAAEQAMAHRFDSGELSWVPAAASGQAAARLASGQLVRWNISDAALNRRIAGQNGTVIHWIGAVRIPGASPANVKSVLEDYDRYARIYRPMVFESKAVRNGDVLHAAYDVVLGLHSSFRFASLFPQHYSFQVKGRIEDTSGTSLSDSSALRLHLAAGEIRESDSGVPGRTDFLEPFHDHGIMWALNAYWRVRRQGKDLYLEFETITLARSVQEFACKIGFVPVPKAVVSAAMDSLPADCVTVILEGTKTECERRARLNVSCQ